MRGSVLPVLNSGRPHRPRNNSFATLCAAYFLACHYCFEQLPEHTNRGTVWLIGRTQAMGKRAPGGVKLHFFALPVLENTRQQSNKTVIPRWRNNKSFLPSRGSRGACVQAQGYYHANDLHFACVSPGARETVGRHPPRPLANCGNEALRVPGCQRDLELILREFVQ